MSVRGYAGCAVLALRGDLDISDGGGLSAWLAAALSCGPWVIVDLAELACIDSSSFGVLALAGWAEVFSVYPGVGLAGFSAGLAAFSGRLAASSGNGRPAGQPDYRGAA